MSMMNEVCRIYLPADAEALGTIIIMMCKVHGNDLLLSMSDDGKYLMLLKPDEAEQLGPGEIDL
jgi:hypothetical protein